MTPNTTTGKTIEISQIAHIKTDFGSKFGVPRQAGLVPELEARIVMEPPYRTPEAFRGLEGFSHVWLLWKFDGVERDNWHATVRPPRLGGNQRIGVFATRSPFRPNPIGLSCVEVRRIDLDTPEGPVIYVSGADLMDGTAIIDIKPYIPFADAHPEARGGYTEQTSRQALLPVVASQDWQERFVAHYADEATGRQKLQALMSVLGQDPRPHYQDDGTRQYGLTFGGQEVRFTVCDGVVRISEQYP